MSKAKAITNNIKGDSYTQIILLKGLILSLVIFGLIYIYLISSITFNVLARKSLETSISSLSTDISQLELKYLNNTNMIDQNYATSNGYVEIKHNIFTSRSITHVAIK